MTEKKVKIFKLVCIGLVLVQTSFAFSAGKKGIKKITSKEEAKEAASELVEAVMPDDNLKVHSLGIGLGQTFLKGDFKKNGDDSISVDAYYNYSASHSFDLMLNAHYSSHSLGDRESTLAGANFGIKGKAYQFDNFAPFLLGGLGFYSPRLTRVVDGQLKESLSKVVFGTHFGAGAELRLNRKFLVGILLHYHNPFDVKQELDPEIEGSYYKLLITTLYSF